MLPSKTSYGPCDNSTLLNLAIAPQNGFMMEVFLRIVLVKIKIYCKNKKL
jgi:hypothetical protein